MAKSKGQMIPSKSRQTATPGFTIYPRDLSITWAEDSRYWEWIKCLDNRRTNQPCSRSHDPCIFDVPRLIEVWYLKIKGKLNTSTLTPETKYELAFTVMLLGESAEGWQTPITVKLKQPNSFCTTKSVILGDVSPQGQWVEIKAGEFVARIGGDIEFSMRGTETKQRKSGLLLRGVVVRPVAEQQSAFKALFCFVARGFLFKFLEMFYEDASRWVMYFVSFMKSE
ncbi:hypothetical protein HPP92_014732 [Vanilla planifolia]|uniref:Uncharacterized protein n=2 Tax=Vanilla planifolia TaxID=51239 RepID=A0A835UX63_VANPL|nr:hypothetical protein HPP92_014732 [Vanilla planifolia]